jgi:hypothetical protein
MDQDPGSAILLNGIPIWGNRADSQVNSARKSTSSRARHRCFLAHRTRRNHQYCGEATTEREAAGTGCPRRAVGHRWNRVWVDGPLGASSDLLYRIDVGFTHSDGFRGAGYDRFDLIPKLFWRITPRDRLRFNVNWNDDHFDLDAGIPLLPLANPLTATTLTGSSSRRALTSTIAITRPATSRI